MDKVTFYSIPWLTVYDPVLTGQNLDSTFVAFIIFDFSIRCNSKNHFLIHHVDGVLLQQIGFVAFLVGGKRQVVDFFLKHLVI